MKSIAFMVPYFGQWPDWFPLTLESIRSNKTIDWFFLSDCGVPKNIPCNTHFIETYFSEYCDLVSERLGLHFNPQQPYKLCDLKPTYAFVHEKLISGYDYWGWCDIDIIFGNLRRFLTNRLLSKKYSCISARAKHISGGLSVFPNNRETINLFSKIPAWEKRLLSPEIQGLDEYAFTHLFLNRRRFREVPVLNTIMKTLNKRKRHAFFADWDMPVLNVQNPSEVQLRWENGELISVVNNTLTYHALFHFVQWKSRRYQSAIDKKMKRNQMVEMQMGCWECLEKLNHVSPGEEARGFTISVEGFHSIDHQFKTRMV